MNHSCFFMTEHCVHGYLHIGFQPISTTYQITWTMASNQWFGCCAAGGLESRLPLTAKRNLARMPFSGLGKSYSTTARTECPS